MTFAYKNPRGSSQPHIRLIATPAFVVLIDVRPDSWAAITPSRNLSNALTFLTSE